MRILTVLLALLSLPAIAAEAKPEIVRATGTPQAIGAVHTVRTIPEACVRLEGMFTSEAAQLYRFAAVKTSPNCQPRARFVDFAKVLPTQAKGWKFNDEIRVPNARAAAPLPKARRRRRKCRRSWSGPRPSASPRHRRGRSS